MSSRQTASRHVHELQEALATHRPVDPSTNEEHLAALTRAILSSIDVRDVADTPTPRLVRQFEHLLHTIAVRKRDEILVRAARDVEPGGWIVETCMDDQPFLVSTVRALLVSDDLASGVKTLNAIVRVTRDPAGNLVSLGTGALESVMRVELPGSEIREGFGERLKHRLAMVQAMVRDFQLMRARIHAVADEYFAAAASARAEQATQLHEVEALLRWLCDENYVLLSVEEWGSDGTLGAAFGTSRIQLPPRDRDLLATAGAAHGRLVNYRRSALESPVHRPGKPGYFVVPRIAADGSVVGTLVIDGLFTYKALHEPPEEIPFVRLALREMLVDRELGVDSHRGKSTTNAFNSLPLEYLLTEKREKVWELTDRVLRAEEKGGSDVYLDLSPRVAFAFVSLPRSEFSEELRQQVQDLLVAELGATYADHGVYFDRYANVIVHFYLTGDEMQSTVDPETVRTKVLALARGWDERLHEAIARIAPPEQREELFVIYRDAFDEVHRRRASVSRLGDDIACLERLRAGAEIDCDLYVSEFGDHPGSLNLRVYSRRPLSLSRQLPVVAHLGFEVVDEYHRQAKLPMLPTAGFHNFRLEVRAERIGHVMGRKSAIVDTMRAVFGGKAGDDDLNRLVVATSLQAREVDILRAYVALLRQLKVPFDNQVLRTALVGNPSVAQALVDWLGARFDPNGASADLAARTADALETELRAVTDYTADRALTAVAEVVRATRRTNAFVRDPDGDAALALKFASQELSFGSEPKPFREIFVHHREFEGVHLRGGKVARGGIRFSDRPDDFRTEIHGLEATQMVKNTVIVPVGAKGGFVLREPPAGRDDLRAAGDRIYRVFVEALLSITDNMIDGKPTTPPGVLHAEDSDPYLVVAADKGTAHLSDTANDVSMSRGFWLDDAFASGGSNGYDHKVTGITARGAWEATKRSFRELGIDPERDIITAVGVGDMSGDVFGNGLLRSKTVKLLGAFNHVHVFIDPDPDPTTSFAERKRLFELPRSQWTDYDAKVLSGGGGVFQRQAKEVALSAQARALLGFGADERVSGEAAVRRLLKLGVDMIWMGGIGTYVKASDESHGDVGDKTNDNARIDADEVRCKVFAEGANLAITERGRVEMARRGTLNYTAFLDNSGGVDLSDHEVNIKILFAPLLRSGKVSREARNELLRRCEPEVVDMVLRNNRSQSRTVSYDVYRSRKDVYRYARTLRHLSRDVPFDPSLFAMPSDEELANRTRKGGGLYKCEGAVLVAHAKMLAYRELLGGDPLGEHDTERMVRAYFPGAVLELAKGAVDHHLLRREIAATMAVNRIVDDAGASFFAEIRGASGRSTVDIATAYLAVVDVLDGESLLRELYGLEDEKRQWGVYAGMEAIQLALEDATFYLLDRREALSFSKASVQSIRGMLDGIEALLPNPARMQARAKRMEEAGLPSEMARHIARLHHLVPAMDAERLSAGTGAPAPEMLKLRFQVAAALDFVELRQALTEIVLGSPWDGPAVSALGRQINLYLHRMVRLVEGGDVRKMIDRFGLDAVRQQVKDHLEGGLSVSGLVMLTDQLRRLLPIDAVKN